MEHCWQVMVLLFNMLSRFVISFVSSAYLRLLIFLSAILIPSCASCSPVFHMMYSAYKLNKQGDSIQPWRAPFPISSQSVVTCSFAYLRFFPLTRTKASWVMECSLYARYVLHHCQSKNRKFLNPNEYLFMLTMGLCSKVRRKNQGN